MKAFPRAYHKKEKILKILVTWSCHNMYHKQSGLKQPRFIFSQFWRPEVRNQGVSRVDFILRPLSFACMWLSSLPCVPTWSSFCASLCSNLFMRTLDIGLGFTHITSFYLDYLFKDPISRYSHPEVWGLGLQQMNLEGTPFSP